jgi:hypothetical protein
MDDKCQLLFVPVRESGSGALALRTGRLPSGQRVGLAFTSEASLQSVFQPCQPWIRLHENAIRYMLGPVGIDHIRVDARLSPAPGAWPAAEPQRAPGRDTMPASLAKAAAPDTAGTPGFAGTRPSGTGERRQARPAGRRHRLHPAGTARRPRRDHWRRGPVTTT